MESFQTCYWSHPGVGSESFWSRVCSMTRNPCLHCRYPTFRPNANPPKSLSHGDLPKEAPKEAPWDGDLWVFPLGRKVGYIRCKHGWPHRRTHPEEMGFDYGAQHGVQGVQEEIPSIHERQGEHTEVPSSGKARAAVRRYVASGTGRAVAKRYQASGNRTTAQQRYQASRKGKAAREKGRPEEEEVEMGQEVPPPGHGAVEALRGGTPALGRDQGSGNRTPDYQGAQDVLRSMDVHVRWADIPRKPETRVF